MKPAAFCVAYEPLFLNSLAQYGSLSDPVKDRPHADESPSAQTGECVSAEQTKSMKRGQKSLKPKSI